MAPISTPAGVYNVPTSPLSSGIFVSKLNSSYAFQWVSTITQSSATGGYASVSGIVTDASANVTLTGNVGGPVLLPNGGGLPSFGNQDIFIARYNTSGALQWIHDAGGSGADNAYGLDVSPNGKRIYTSNTIGASPFIQYDGSKVSASGVYISRYEE